MLFHCALISLPSLIKPEFPVISHCGMWDSLKWGFNLTPSQCHLFIAEIMRGRHITTNTRDM